MVAKLWYLKKIDLFSRLPHEEIQKLSEKTRMDNISANEPIYFPGDSSNTIYILKQGRVRISRSTEDGKKITIALLEKGEIFGELALSDEDERDTIAETAEDSLICAVPDDQFLEFLSDHPELSFEINRLMGNRRREIEAKIENLIFRDAEGRVAYVLEDLFQNHTNDDKLDSSEITFSHQEVADLSGLTRPTTTNLLNKMQNEDIIELNRRSIRLLDPHGLRNKASPS